MNLRSCLLHQLGKTFLLSTVEVNKDIERLDCGANAACVHQGIKAMSPGCNGMKRQIFLFWDQQHVVSERRKGLEESPHFYLYWVESVSLKRQVCSTKLFMTRNSEVGLLLKNLFCHLEVSLTANRNGWQASWYSNKRSYILHVFILFASSQIRHILLWFQKWFCYYGFPDHFCSKLPINNFQVMRK